MRDLKTACVQTLRGHDGTVTSLAVHNRLLFSCSTDRTLRLWQMDEGRDMLLYPWYTLQETVQGHDCWLNALALHVIGESGEVFAADERGCVCAFQLAIRGRLVSLSRWQQHPSVHGLSIVAMLLVPGENLLFTISFDQTMRALNVSSGVPVLTVANPRKVRFTGMHWHEGTRQLFLVDELGYLLAWSIGAERCTKDEQLLAAVRTAPSSAPGFVSVSAHADELFAADQAGCHCWHILRDLGYTEVGGHTGPVIALVSSEGSRESDGLFYSASVDNTIRGWEPGAMACVSTLHEVHSEIASLLYSAANGFLISGHDDGSIRLWNSESGSTINLVEHTNTVCCLELGVRGRTELLLSAGFDGCVALWDITKRKHAMPHIETIFRAHEPYEILALRFNPLNGTIISAGNDRQIRVWSVATYELLGALDGHTDSVTALALDGNFLLSGSEDCTVRVWDTHANTVRPLCRLGAVRCPQKAGLGQGLARQQPVGTPGRPRAPCLRPALACCLCTPSPAGVPLQLLQTIVAHDEPVEQLLVVPETGFLVTCSSRCIRVWHYGEEHLLTEWRHPDAIRSLGLLRKQRKIACGTEQCRIVLFSLDEVAWPPCACGPFPACLRLLPRRLTVCGC